MPAFRKEGNRGNNSNMVTSVSMCKMLRVMSTTKHAKQKQTSQLVCAEDEDDS